MTEAHRVRHGVHHRSGRTALLIAMAGLSAPAAATAARACDAVATECLPTAVAFPAYTPEGIRVGTVVARVAHPLPLEPSRYTGQPRAVVFNDPGSFPGAVDPGLTLVPLPRVRLFDTQGAYPSGY